MVGEAVEGMGVARQTVDAARQWIRNVIHLGMGRTTTAVP